MTTISREEKLRKQKLLKLRLRRGVMLWDSKKNGTYIKKKYGKLISYFEGEK